MAAAPVVEAIQAETLLKPSREQFRQMGYTGNQCNFCSSSRMKVSGHCEVCEECGTTTGCS